MRTIARGFAALPPQQRRLAWLLVAAALAVFLVWFFLLRDTRQGNSGATSPPPRPALGKTIPFGEYRRAVADALSQVQSAQSLSGDDRKKALEAAAGTLEKVEGAHVDPAGAGAGAAEIDNTRLLGEMRAASPDLGQVEAGLSALSQTLESAGADYLEGTLAGEAAKQELQRVLSHQTFDYERDLSPLQRLARWLGGITGKADPAGTLWRWLTSLIAGLAAGTLAYLASDKLGNRWARMGLGLAAGMLVGALFYSGLGALGTTIQVVGAVGLVLAAVAVALLMTGVHRASAPAGGARRVSELAAMLGMSAGEGRRRAQESADAGDFRSAIRYRCLALLLAFDEVGKLHFDRAATSREYLFRAPGDLQGELQPLLTRFDAVWYGGEQADAAEWQAYAAHADSIEAKIGESADVGNKRPTRSAA